MKNTVSNIGIGLLGIMLIARVLTLESETSIREESKVEFIKETEISATNFINFSSFTPLIKNATPKAKTKLKLKKVAPAVATEDVEPVLVTETKAQENLETSKQEKETFAYPLDGRSTLTVNLSHHFPRKKINVKKSYSPTK
ncbi:hypothetical protein [Crocinitomix catalasitica]|uniref:hypothetical protein n=1 Tax=Crocinitomix catalasitica TaxID=184607 RepID=UPI0004867B07|nr:hypothetical protein [Crocinitomix catalasitica]